MKNTTPVIGTIVVAICIVAVIFSGCIESDSKISEGSLIEMTYFTGVDVPKGLDVHWIEFDIKKDGDAKFIKFMHHDILEAKYGNLTKEELDSLLAFIETEDFYEMNESYEHEKGLMCEGNFTTITVNAENRYKSLFAHCILAPDSFYEIRKKLMNIGENLPYQQFGIFIRAEELDARRVSKIRENFEFISLSGEMEKYPFLMEAINGTGEFIYVGSWDKTEIDELVLKKYNYFFIEVNNKYYQIDVYANKNESSSSSHFQYTEVMRK